MYRSLDIPTAVATLDVLMIISDGEAFAVSAGKRMQNDFAFHISCRFYQTLGIVVVGHAHRTHKSDNAVAPNVVIRGSL